MGNLLKLMNKSEDGEMNDVIIDFENCTPSEFEKDIYDKVSDLIAGLDVCSEVFATWGARLCSKIYSETDDHFLKKSKFFFDLYHLMEAFKKEIPNLVGTLLKECDKADLTSGNFFNYQALSKIYVKILNSSLKFDIAKLSNPDVCNDLSTIKRSIGLNNELSEEIGLSAEQLSFFSITLAYCDPMIREITSATKDFLQKECIDPRNAARTLSILARVCKKMVSTSEIYEQFRSPDTRLFVLNVMVSLLVMSDHIHPDGLLSDPTSEYDTFLKILLQFPDKSNHLMKVLRYQSKTGNSPTLKSSIKNLFTKNMGS